MLPKLWLMRFLGLTVFAVGALAGLRPGGAALADSGGPEGAPVTLIYLPLLTRPAMGLANGDFESGPAGWSVTATHGLPVIRTSFPGSVTPHGGAYAAWLGGAPNATTEIAQSVTIRSGNATLTYWDRIASSDVCGYDFGRVLVNGTAVETLDLCSSANTSGWRQRAVDLGGYAGQTVTLAYRATTDGSLNSNWFIDDAAWQAGASAAAVAVDAGGAGQAGDAAPMGGE
jgi:hypothetical protein